MANADAPLVKARPSRLRRGWLGSPLPRLSSDWAHPRHICTGTGPTAAASATGARDALVLNRYCVPSAAAAAARASEALPTMCVRACERARASCCNAAQPVATDPIDAEESVATDRASHGVATQRGALRPARRQQQELSNTKDYSGAPIALTAAAAARVTLSTTATKATTTFTAGDVRCRDRRLEGACESG
jgi:hypothetical protein